MNENTTLKKDVCENCVDMLYCVYVRKRQNYLIWLSNLRDQKSLVDNIFRCLLVLQVYLTLWAIVSIVDDDIIHVDN